MHRGVAVGTADPDVGTSGGMHTKEDDAVQRVDGKRDRGPGRGERRKTASGTLSLEIGIGHDQDLQEKAIKETEDPSQDHTLLIVMGDRVQRLPKSTVRNKKQKLTGALKAVMSQIKIAVLHAETFLYRDRDCLR